MSAHSHPTGPRNQANASPRPLFLSAIVGAVNVLVAIFFLGGVFKLVQVVVGLFRGTETAGSALLQALLGGAYMAGSWFVFGWVNRAAARTSPDLGSEAR